MGRKYSFIVDLACDSEVEEESRDVYTVSDALNHILRYYLVVEDGFVSCVFFFDDNYIYRTEDYAEYEYKALQDYCKDMFGIDLVNFDELVQERSILSASRKHIYFSEDVEMNLNLRPDDFFSDFYQMQKLYKAVYFQRKLTPDWKERFLKNFCHKYCLSMVEAEEMMTDYMTGREMYGIYCDCGYTAIHSVMLEDII